MWKMLLLRSERKEKIWGSEGSWFYYGWRNEQAKLLKARTWNIDTWMLLCTEKFWLVGWIGSFFFFTSSPFCYFLPFLLPLLPFSALLSWEAWFLHLWRSAVASNGRRSYQVNLCLHPLLGKWRLSLCTEPTWNWWSGLRGVIFHVKT